MNGEKKGGFWQRLFGLDAGEEAKKEPPKREPERKEPPSGKPDRKEPPKPKPARKEPPERKRPPKQAEAAPPPAGPQEVPGDRPPEERPAESREKGTPHSPEDPGPKPKGPGGKPPTPKTKAPPPAGPATAPGATPPEDRPPGTREKGTPDEPDLPPKDAEGPSKASLQSPGPRRSWFAQLTQGLSRSSAALGDNLASVLTRRKLDEETLDELEEALIKADLGVAMASRIRSRLAAARLERGLSPEGVREVLAAEIAEVLEPVAEPLRLEAEAHPHVILLVGVNGTGKTTTAAKLAHRFIGEGKTVMIAAADTFRAAAIDQLKVWGGRVGAEVVAKTVGADPAGLAFEALERAKAEGTDVLVIDTAGRLQNKSDLMAELAKIVRVLKKLDPGAPHSVVLVLDATTGQNALAQVETFEEIAGVTSLIVTKLDGTARGGILVAIAERFGLKVNAIGVGEGVDDLQAFEARDFARAIAGLDRKDAKAA